jgi:hypothetical protein
MLNPLILEVLPMWMALSSLQRPTRICSGGCRNWLSVVEVRGTRRAVDLNAK